MDLHCPNCGAKIPGEEISISADLGKCTVCQNIFPVEELTANR